jgi:23S rRNA (uracil1939-C5)-methyltransferase
VKRRGAGAPAVEPAPRHGTEVASTGATIELTIDSLAAGGDGVGRGAEGRVVFVPRTAPGDHVAVELVQATTSFARGHLRTLITSSSHRRESGCPAFEAGCGGCQWLHVDDLVQREAKQQLATSALRQLAGLHLRPIVDRVPALGWRRRARFHVRGGRLGLYATRTHQVIVVDGCAQLDPRLAAALPAIAASAPPDGELALAVGVGDRIALVHGASAWPGAAALVGRAGIVGVATATASWGEPVIEIEPGLWGRADAFAQASTAGNAAIIGAVIEALGPGKNRGALELFAGAGNLTRAIVDAGWRVLASDAITPARPLPGVEWITADAEAAMQRLKPRRGQFAAVILDPPRTGAKAIVAALAGLGAARLVYVSCDAATLARDASLLTQHGYRATVAQPIDTMPQTSHFEIVLTLER